MDKETIIFFDKLGFGWVLDKITAKEMKLNHLEEQDTVNKSLIKIIENLLDYRGVWSGPGTDLANVATLSMTAYQFSKIV